MRLYRRCHVKTAQVRLRNAWKEQLPRVTPASHTHTHFSLDFLIKRTYVAYYLIFPIFVFLIEIQHLSLKNNIILRFLFQYFIMNFYIRPFRLVKTNSIARKGSGASSALTLPGLFKQPHSGDSPLHNGNKHTHSALGSPLLYRVILRGVYSCFDS